ncbi:FAD-dependent monooxygenase [Bacillus sp. N1-1]|uniref:FAD-dependent monooxygenase n=1 Tax=Bacillus sp. N1-1 TaxID=2682541 RepID=UPI001319ABEF|nr:FAD-dependent monooxygenase [Bacillus sp. N1-1]QHA91555.1 NAD(P)-binding protein [Bacillus sp. N1-1]
MELHHGNLFWPTTVQKSRAFPELTTAVTCDVLIIGGGMSGSIMARILADYQIDTVLIEKDTIASGSIL